MRMLLLFLLCFPAFVWGQTETELQETAIAWNKAQVDEELSTFNSVSFNRVDTLRELATEGQQLLDSLRYIQYKLQQNALDQSSEKIDLVNYKKQWGEMMAKMKAIRKGHTKDQFYVLQHHFTTTDSKLYRIYYTTEFTFDLNGKVLTTSTKRRVDKRNSDF